MLPVFPYGGAARRTVLLGTIIFQVLAAPGAVFHGFQNGTVADRAGQAIEGEPSCPLSGLFVAIEIFPAPGAIGKRGRSHFLAFRAGSLGNPSLAQFWPFPTPVAEFSQNLSFLIAGFTYVSLHKWHHMMSLWDNKKAPMK
jgi:hypothetical protein